MRFLRYDVTGDDLAYGNVIYINPMYVSTIMEMDSGRAMLVMTEGTTHWVQQTAERVRSDVESAYTNQ